MAKKMNPNVETSDMAKIACWVPHSYLAAMREIEAEVGCPISESVRRALKVYLRNQGKKVE